MKIIIVNALIWMLANCSWAGGNPITAEQLKILEDVEHVKILNSKTNIPPQVMALFPGGIAGMADPNQKWEPTDVISEPELPSRRLIWAAVNGDCYVIHHEKGGIGYSCQVALVSITKSEAKIRWSGYGGPFKTYEKFLNAAKHNKLEFLNGMRP